MDYRSAFTQFIVRPCGRFMNWIRTDLMHGDDFYSSTCRKWVLPTLGMFIVGLGLWLTTDFHLLVALALPLVGVLIMLAWRNRESLLHRSSTKASDVSPPERTDPAPVAATESKLKIDDTQSIPIVPAKVSASPPTSSLGRGEHYVAVRHWKFFAKRLHQVAISLIIASTATYVSYRYGAVSGWQYLIVFLLWPATLWLYKREMFRWKHTLVVLRDYVIEFSPAESRFYILRGEPTAIPLDKYDSLSYGKQTFFELWFFKRSRTVTIDTSALRDEQLHDMKDILDPKGLEAKIEMLYRQFRNRAVDMNVE